MSLDANRQRMAYRPFDIGCKFRVVPEAGAEGTTSRTELIMQRGAFGSGEHETTVSCLEFLENLPDLERARLLDLGSGTGILSIAALKLGAAQAVCIDIDPQAVETAQSNCRVNGVADRTTHIVGTLADLATSDFDLVLANIYGDILLDLANPLTAALRKGGHLLLSGILWEDNFPVRQAYADRGCEILANRFLEEFSTVLARKA